MFGSVALDVFIGLVLIYLLYSLLVTIIGEMIATWLGLRARILKKAIEKMLNDDTIKSSMLPDLLMRTGEFFLYEFDEFQNSFAGRFYKHPSIKYLAQGQKKHAFSFRQGKPAYISKENFTDTLIQMFRNKGTGKDDIEKINFCLKFNTLQIQPQTLSHLKNLVADANNDLPAFKEKLMQWFNDTMDRTNGWYKRKLQLILFWLGFIIAVAFNVDSIKMAQQLSHDKDVRTQLVQMAIQVSDTTSILARAIQQTNDSAAADTLLRKSFTDVKMAAENANRILGLGWEFNGFKRISRKYDKITERGIQNILIKPIKTIEDSIRKYDNLIKKAKSEKEKNGEKKILAKYRNQQKGLLTTLNKRIETKFIAIDSTHRHKTKVIFYGKYPVTACSNFWYVIRQSMPWHLSFWGFVITALMISLGAPFWFDLLKKLVALRGAGVKPEEREENKTKPVTSLNQDDRKGQAKKTEQPDTNNDELGEALELFTQKIRDEKGIVAIALEPLKDKSNFCISVHVENSRNIPYLVSKYGIVQTLSSGNTMPVSYSESSRIDTHKGDCGCEITNKYGSLGPGTLCCFLQDKVGKKYILSCWHVLKDNSDWDQSIRKKEIVAGKETIGYVVEGCLTNNLDIGIALCNENNSLSNAAIPITAQHGTVDPYDALINTDVLIFGKVTNKQNAKIFHHKVNASLTYPGESTERIIYDTFSIAKIDEKGNAKSPTLPGDSGAMVMTIKNGKNVPLGMIIGGNNNFSYAIKFSNAFNPDKIYHNYSFILT